MRLCLCADAFNTFDTPVLNREDGLHVQHCTEEPLCATNAATPMQEFKRVHSKEHASVFVRFLSQSDGFLNISSRFDRACNSQSLKTKRHRDRLTIHNMD